MKHAIFLIGLLLTTACAPDLNDITANNKEYTGPYDVLSRQTDANGAIVLRVRVYHPSATERIARNITHQLANQAQHGIVIETIDAGDDATHEPRRVLHWPSDIRY